ncbi:hypothetical protein L6R53_08045 [Myxococcota bacterium]|nr:hypothetical protein [Myxococcota bacterium]
MSPDLLGPAALTPAVLTPAVLTPAVLSPAVLSPAVLAPQVQTLTVQPPAVLVTVDRVEHGPGPPADGWVVLEWQDGSLDELPLALWASPPREGARLRLQADPDGPPRPARPSPRPAALPDEVDLTSPWRPPALDSPSAAAPVAAAPPSAAIPASGTPPTAAPAVSRGAP